MIIQKVHCILWHIWLMSDFFITAAIIRITNRNKIKRRQRYLRNNARISKKFLKAFNIKLNVKHIENLKQLHKLPYLAVSNHTTYLDIIILASLENYIFITSVEMRGIPFLGKITRNGGCLYTNRKKYVSLPEEINRFTAALLQGFKVMLFPEGTSTNGITVQPFHKSLFQIAIKAKCPVLPICIKYLTLDGKKIQNENRDRIAWYGKMNFLLHYLKLVGHKLEAEVEILEATPYQEGKTRQDISDDAYQKILKCYQQEKFS